MAADIETIHVPGKLGPHELVLLHGQPGSPADWQPLAERPPAQLRPASAPGCVNGWDRLLAAPGAGQLCALVAWRLTP
jgi:hypothetical protein